MSKRRKHKSRRPRLHRGLWYNRVESDKRLHGITLEVAMAEEWEKENHPQRGYNYGYGVLQDLMIGQWDRSRICRLQPNAIGWSKIGAWEWPEWARFIISRRDATIVASVIQWLGTNCGRDFLRRALERAGYRMVSLSESEAEARVRESLKQSTEKMRAELERLRRLESTITKQRAELEAALR